MTNTATPIRKEHSNAPIAENHKGIENHKQTAKHLEEAAKHHLDAAKHHEAGNHEKASASTIKAHGQNCLANELQREDAKHHAIHG
ncbi:MAG TPA: hypothetical protein VNZ49_09445 [Bacteroidia bacterium]|jgi:hypothetical protein|nr:hypothetical protein [Bacteroidia bacterium]